MDAGADYLIAVNASQPGLFAEIQSFLDDLGGGARARHRHRQRPRPNRGAPRRRIHRYRLVEGRAPCFQVASRPFTESQTAAAIRVHWAIEISLHWAPDVTFYGGYAEASPQEGLANFLSCATSPSPSSAWSTTAYPSICAENEPPGKPILELFLKPSPRQPGCTAGNGLGRRLNSAVHVNLLR